MKLAGVARTPCGQLDYTVPKRARAAQVRAKRSSSHQAEPTMRAELIGHFEPCMTEIYLHIDARMAD